MKYGGFFDVNSKIEEIKSLEKETLKEDFWSNKESTNILKEISEKKELVNSVIDVKEEIDFFKELSKETDIEEEIKNIQKKIKTLENEVLLNEKFDHNSALLEVHSGAGGVEACDWAKMLVRMYLRFSDIEGYKASIIDLLEGEEAGYKTCVIEIKGKNAYGYLKKESGVHRLVRFSPFDSANKRHTSFASIKVIPLVDEEENVEIRQQDLKIDTYRSGGAGGQHVNTTDSAVRITHLPTGTIVSCQSERSQIQNKERAMKLLKSKLFLLEEEKRENEKKKNYLSEANVEFGTQIRSYVMCPYKQVKDNRSGYETSNIEKILDGEIKDLLETNLRMIK